MYRATRSREGRLCLVGDSAIDVRTDKAAGISTISVLTGVGVLEDLIHEEPDLIIDNLGELPSRIAL